MGMRTAGPSCCCCPDFWVLSRNPADTHYGWRKLYTSGTYPGHTIEIHETPVNTPQSTELFCFDYRNKKIYTFGLLADTIDVAIVEYSADMANRREVIRHTLTIFSGPFTMGLAVDYDNGKIFYAKWLKYEDPTPADFESEIRSCDLDGSNDVQVTTDEGNISYLVWEPTNNTLYYQNASISTSTTYLKRMNADGTGKTDLVTLTPGVGDSYQIRGIGVVPSTEQVFWWEWFSTGAITTQDLKVGDLDCAGAATILVGDSDAQYYFCKPNQKDGRIYFEWHTDAAPGVDYLDSIEADGGDRRTEWDNTHANWADYSSSSGFVLEAGFGCRRETTGSDYIGSSYSTGYS